MLGSKGILTPLIPDCSVLRTITILNDIFVVSDFIRICSVHIRNFCNRDISGAIIFMNQFFHLPNLKTVYHDVHYCLRGIRIISLRLGDRHPTLKGFGECRADLIRMHRDDCSRFGSIQTFHNKVHCLQRCPGLRSSTVEESSCESQIRR